MQKLFSVVVFFFLYVSLIAQENISHCAKIKQSHYQNKISPYLSPQQVLSQKKYDVTFYALDLNMSNLNTTISGVVEIHGIAVQATDSVLLEFFNSFTINSIKVNGTNVSYNRILHTLNIPVNLNLGESFIISVDYYGTPPTASSNPLGGSGMSNATSSSWGNQITWSLSEPFSAFEWFPCKQDLKDKADSSRFTITVPNNLMAGSNGVLDSVTTTPGYKTFHWMHHHPIDYYLISVAVGSYQEYTIYANPTGSSQPVMIQNFIYDNPSFLSYYQNDIDETVDFIELFADLYGPYPYQDEKYGHCIAPLGGGMEHQTMTTQGFFSPTLTAHELAHQWWGDHVTCGSWADIWINEGFASYSEYLMYENLYGDYYSVSKMNDVHNYVMSDPNGSVWVLDSMNASSIFSGRLVYNKGSAIIHTLRYIINDDNLFFNTLRNFQQVFADSTATGLEFKSFVELETGLDLTDFFNQWYFGEGYPTYSIEYNQNGTDIGVLVSHSTSSSTSTFTNPIDIRLVRSGGLGDTIVRVNIINNGTYTTITNIENFVSIDTIDPSNFVVNTIGSIASNPNLSITNNETLDNYIIYPNPTSDNFKILLNGQDKCFVRILDAKGRLIKEVVAMNNENINISELKEGNYLIEITDDKKQSIVRKVIKK